MNILNNYLTPQSPVNQTVTPKQNQVSPTFSNPLSSTKLSMAYSNDLHGQLPKMTRLVSAYDHAERQAQAKGSDILKISSGDEFIGSDIKRNSAVADYINISGIHAKSLDNHGFDMTASVCGQLLKNSKAKVLGMNVNFPHQNSDLAQKVISSTVVDGQSGEKYGLIGIAPVDLVSRVKKKEILEGLTVDDKEQTIKGLQEEVNKLHSQGINKIFLLSHSGNDFEKEIAQKVSGIDVIAGGHSHDLIHGVKEGENLLYSPAGEPVVITQAGRDGNNFGILELEFNPQGQITYVQNNLYDTNKFPQHNVMARAIDAKLGKSPVIGTLGHADPIPKNNIKEENPWADFVADACRNALDTDIVLINSANFRGSVGLGEITERDISSIFPFCNKLFKVRINEKDVVDAVKHCAKTLVSKNGKPGIMQVSGLTYTLDSQGNLLDMYYVDKQGNKQQVNVNNPDENKFYTAVYDEFLINGGDNMDMLVRKDDQILERYDFDKDKVTINYIKSLSQPFEVKSDGRIKIV